MVSHHLLVGHELTINTIYSQLDRYSCMVALFTYTCNTKNINKNQ